jgi:hypothetical protein
VVRELRPGSAEGEGLGSSFDARRCHHSDVVERSPHEGGRADGVVSAQTRSTCCEGGASMPFLGSLWGQRRPGHSGLSIRERRPAPATMAEIIAWLLPRVSVSARFRACQERISSHQFDLSSDFFQA